ncbi:hypothetical protein L218DRAFT_676683 [Marasmius fiardii PR-910]|nr:hypothetical protein L218DRAFT_676683 [Marasmius fiardii PR-910]
MNRLSISRKKGTTTVLQFSTGISQLRWKNFESLATNMGTVRRFNERHGLTVRTWVDITRPISKGPVVLLKVVTNYGTSLSSDAVVDLCEDAETSFGKRGKWYISNANESLCDDYYISLPKKKKKSKKTTGATSSEDGKRSE